MYLISLIPLFFIFDSPSIISAQSTLYDIGDTVDESDIKRVRFKLEEGCTAVFGDSMPDPNEATAELTSEEVKNMELSCLTESGNIYTIAVDENKWLKQMIVRGSIVSGMTKIVAPDKTNVYEDTQTLDLHKSDLQFITDLGHSELENNLVRRRLVHINKVGGNRIVLVVHVELSDAVVTSTEQELSDSVFGNGVDPVNLSSQYHACSNGKLSFSKADDRQGLSTSIANGVVSVKLDLVSKTAHHAYIRNKVTAELNYQFNVASPLELADHIMYCLPPGAMPAVAYGVVNSFISVYADKWCTYVSAQMHEIGHNMGWGHSNTPTAMYADRSGMMGFSYPQSDGPLLCFNAAQSWRSGWFGQKHVLLNDVQTEISERRFSFVGMIQNYNVETDQNSHPMLIRIDNDTPTSYFIGYNGLTNYNTGTTTPNKVVVYCADNIDLPGTDTVLLATLDAGESYTVYNYTGTGTDLSIAVYGINYDNGIALVTANADVAVESKALFSISIEGSCDSNSILDSLIQKLYEYSREGTTLLQVDYTAECQSGRKLEKDSRKLNARDRIDVLYDVIQQLPQEKSVELLAPDSLVQLYSKDISMIASEVANEVAIPFQITDIHTVEAPSASPTNVASEHPTMSPTPEGHCKDLVEGWHDADGHSYDCKWYSVGDRCQSFGLDSPNFGYSALECCCSCGGGTPATPSPTTAPSETPECIDRVENWFDGDGPLYTCHWYSQDGRCGAFGDQSVGEGGFTANQACCSCGGGNRPTDAPSSSPTVSCNDLLSTWHDPDGDQYTCEWYGEGSNCQDFGDSYPNFGYTANECCCSCGGGLKLSDAPTKSPVSSCVDVQGWYDSGGPEYTCDWYKTQDGCVQFGNDYSNFGFTANQACCVCGGGEEITPSPTLSPTSSPVATCVDLVEGWDDGDGPAFNCDWYGQGDRCIQLGDDYPNMGFTANQNCCSCGGGRSINGSPTLAPTIKSTTVRSFPDGCTDLVENWFDSEGPDYTCNWYAVSDRCSSIGNAYPNMGFTASQNCCICGGGNKAEDSPTSPPPTAYPSQGTPEPTKSPTFSPVGIPSKSPSSSPSKEPTKFPTATPTKSPTPNPTVPPTLAPTSETTASPTATPTKSPTPNPTVPPTLAPTSETTTSPTICVNSPENWHDSDGSNYNCDWYSTGGNCESYGHLTQYAMYGKTANEACCGCGGGNKISSTEEESPTLQTLNPTPSPTACLNSPENWHDTDGEAYNCEWYSNGGNCQAYGHLTAYAMYGKTANEACCGCGGGHKFRAEEEPTNNNSTPTLSPQIDNPTASPTSCLNSPENWHDTDGPNYNCYWYSQGANCETYGHLTAYAMYGKTANEACCGCGGGARSTGNTLTAVTSTPTMTPSNSPISSLTTQCVDKYEGWHDADGPSYGCVWYGEGSRCDDYGHSYANFGFTASEACCSCGGGNISS